MALKPSHGSWRLPESLGRTELEFLFVDLDACQKTRTFRKTCKRHVKTSLQNGSTSAFFLKMVKIEWHLVRQ